MSEKICIIGDGITALILAKVLLDLNIEIDLVNQNTFNKKKLKFNRSCSNKFSSFKKLVKIQDKN